MANEEIKIGDEGIFAEAKDFDQLFPILEKEKEIIGSDGITQYSAEEIIKSINDLREKLEDMWEEGKFKEAEVKDIESTIQKDSKAVKIKRQITRQGGLRDKVLALAIQEVIKIMKEHPRIITN